MTIGTFPYLIITVTAVLMSACSSTPPSAQSSVQTPLATSVAIPETTAPPQKVFTYVAKGTQPNWHVTTFADNSLRFVSPKHPKGITLPAERSAYAKGVNYLGHYQGTPFVLDINSRTCHYPTPDNTLTLRAIFEIDGQVYKGCGRLN